MLADIHKLLARMYDTYIYIYINIYMPFIRHTVRKSRCRHITRYIYARCQRLQRLHTNAVSRDAHTDAIIIYYILPGICREATSQIRAGRLRENGARYTNQRFSGALVQL
jgi:hypothetical protein